MIESDRVHFDSALDRLADRIHCIPLSVEAKGDYWKRLKVVDPERFLMIVENLISNYKPRWMSDFPSLKDFNTTLNSLPIPDSMIFHSYPCRCCNVRPHGDGKLACQCDLEQCFQCFHCGKCCKCLGGPIPLEELPEWKAVKKQFGLVTTK